MFINNNMAMVHVPLEDKDYSLVVDRMVVVVHCPAFF